jgi:DNA-binding transcriptional MerR regulator
MAATTKTRERARLARREPTRIALDALARRAGLHPEVVRRLVRLGLIQPSGGNSATPLFRAQDALVLARAARLRRDLGLNYAGAVLAVELLARIEKLEEQGRGDAPTRRPQEVIAGTRIV